MARHADGHGVKARPGQIADGAGVLDRRDDGQRSGPERAGQRHGAVVEVGDAPGRLQVGDMGDQRIEARSALGLENRRDRRGVRRVRTEPIDRLGRQ